MAAPSPLARCFYHASGASHHPSWVFSNAGFIFEMKEARAAKITAIKYLYIANHPNIIATPDHHHPFYNHSSFYCLGQSSCPTVQPPLPTIVPYIYGTGTTSAQICLLLSRLQLGDRKRQLKTTINLRIIWNQIGNPQMGEGVGIYRFANECRRGGG